MRLYLKSFFLLLLAILFLGQVYGQEKRKIDILSSRKGVKKNIDGVPIFYLSGNVKIKHNENILVCDSAEVDDEKNDFKAFGNVNVITKDSVNIYADRLFYFGETKKSHFYDNVKLIDSTSTLTTEYLVYDRNTESAIFNNWGTIVDDSTTLVSKNGEYFKETKEFLFVDSVEVSSPKYTISTDTLWYNRETEFIRFRGPTTMTGKNKYVFALKGWMDTKNDITSLKTQAYIRDEEQIIQGDTVYYDKKRGYGYAFDGAHFEDLKNDMNLSGKIFEYIKDKGYAYATDSALAILKEKKDSLYLHSDTIKILLDSADKAEYMHAYDNARFYKKDLQGICGKLIYSMKDSVISMFNLPVLWSEENQLSSDSSRIYMSNKKADSLILYNSAFITSKDSTEYNQIKGRNVKGYFKDNELKRINVNGNSETIYFIRDDETKELTGLKKAVASKMTLYLTDKKISSIVYKETPKVVIHPIEEVSQADKQLEGFKWWEEYRPLSREDVFRDIKISPAMMKPDIPPKEETDIPGKKSPPQKEKGKKKMSREELKKSLESEISKK